MKSGVLLSLLLFVLTTAGFAQRSPVDETEMAVKGIPRKGQRVTIQLDSKRVEDSWVKLINEKIGKVKADKGVYSMDGVVVESISKTPIRIISKVDAVPTGTTVWWSIDLGNAYLSKEATPQQWKSAEAYLKDFARSLYREDIALQVQEAEKALINSQNNHMAVIAKQDAIKKDIEKNKAKKLEIQQQLAENAADLVKLNNMVDSNLKEQEAARADIVNMRVQLESVKDRLNKIE
ncbi:DNA repair ATPase [Hymenobacter sp. 15J16-1T3B]|uniref:DNA repair ATPase n=1 Tax=Hymenobacter sp. 15J16-1T3B TaxID=2886941 RepID=UPI001D10AA48|nr:DNA repair ATPase [Hymenobacter sp. 15J16-1T3B]MCC3157207.1 DNA repair ATPase [Hymenobacter sp. 15J16-1T3B]